MSQEVLQHIFNFGIGPVWLAIEYNHILVTFSIVLNGKLLVPFDQCVPVSFCAETLFFENLFQFLVAENIVTHFWKMFRFG